MSAYAGQAIWRCEVCGEPTFNTVGRHRLCGPSVEAYVKSDEGLVVKALMGGSWVDLSKVEQLVTEFLSHAPCRGDQ